MATARKPSKRPSPKPKRKTAKAITAPRAPSTTTVSAKAFAAALARIDALERKLARLSALPITVAPGGDVTIEAGASLILRGASIKLEAAATVQMQAARIDVTAGIVNADSGIFNASGIVKCDTLQTNTVIASSYTPGAGNVW